jgi:hypothetical protein
VGDDFATRMDERGRKLQRSGAKLTVGLTVPIVLTVLFGWVGLAIGLAIGMAVFASWRA